MLEFLINEDIMKYNTGKLISPKVNVSVNIEKAIWDKFGVIAEDQGYSKSCLLNTIVERWTNDIHQQTESSECLSSSSDQ